MCLLLCLLFLQLLAVSTSKARLHLSPTATFEDYLAAEYAADEVSETLIDPLTPSGIEAMSSKKERSSKGGSLYSSGGDTLGADADADGLVWGESSGAAGSSRGSGDKKELPKVNFKKSSSSKSSKEAAGADADGGRVLKARCWMAQDFPMSLAQLLPLLDVIGNANKHMAKVGAAGCCLNV